MEIKLKTEPRGPWKQIQIDTPQNVEQLIQTYKKMTGEEPEFMYLAANVDNTLKDLNFIVDKSCQIELLDMRTQSANLIYQHSLSLIYLKAINDMIGNVEVEIQNSLNKGLYTEIKTEEPLTDEKISLIELRMKALIEQDIPFIKEIVPKEDVMGWLKSEGLTEKARLLNEKKELTQAKFYSLLDYKNFFYGLMVPSTRYIEHFEVKRYRKGILLRYPNQNKPDEILPYQDQKMLYAAFGEAAKWHRLMEVSFVEDLNEKVRSGEYKELVQLSEALHEKKVAEIADMITKQQKRIILIAGPSSSGKTTFARRLCIQLRVNGLKPLYLGTDDYFMERSETPLDDHGEPNYEDLSAIDIDLFNANMNGLLTGEEVDLPIFDFLEGKKIYGTRVTQIDPDQPIVIEGIHGLNDELTKDIKKEEKFKIYVSPFTQLNIDNHNRIPTADARMLRRMVRDYAYRGHSAQGTIADWPKVRIGEEKNIFPYIDDSDVVFNSVHIYELAVLKKYAQPLLENITQDEPEHAEAMRMLKFLEFFEIIEDDCVIVNNSILREFIGGSIFVEEKGESFTAANVNRLRR